MKSHAKETTLPANPRFHVALADGLYRPIPFMFVGERLCADILAERSLILSALPQDQRDRQARIFESFDPHASHRAFQDILRCFGVGAGQH